MPGDLSANAEIVLPAQSGEHLTRVLRLEAGAPVTIFNGQGGEYSAVLGARSGKKVLARLGRHDAVERESPLTITLLQGVARGERMDLIVQKATELGVARIVPVLAERSVVKVDAKQRERKLEHWQSIAISACEQCGRNRVPEVSTPAALGDAIAALPAGSLRCLLAADAWRVAGRGCTRRSIRRRAAHRPRGRSGRQRTSFCRRQWLRRVSAGSAHPAHGNRGSRGARGAAGHGGRFRLTARVHRLLTR